MRVRVGLVLEWRIGIVSGREEEEVVGGVEVGECLRVHCCCRLRVFEALRCG